MPGYPKVAVSHFLSVCVTRRKVLKFAIKVLKSPQIPSEVICGLFIWYFFEPFKQHVVGGLEEKETADQGFSEVIGGLLIAV